MLQQIYTTHSLKSKLKCFKFFGTTDIGIHVGGDPQKLSSFYGVLAKNQRHHPNEDDLLETGPQRLTPLLERSNKPMSLLGSGAPVDLTLKEVEECGLFACLNSCFALGYFFAHLMTENAPESLFFIWDCLEFECTVFPTNRECQEKAVELFQLYIQNDATFELNLTYRTKRNVAQRIHAFSTTCFGPALKEVIEMLEKQYLRFLISPSYQLMKASVLPHQSGRTKTQVDSLLHYLHLSLPLKSPIMDEQDLKRVDMISVRLEQFVAKRLTIFS
ncbi:RGS domain-containing protein [Gorgonomyces haynaldii]|nr:RGS domain-containing protein [Gorgonomyces haynaldii]